MTRRNLGLVAALVIFVALYGLSAVMYAASSRGPQLSANINPAPNEVSVAMVPTRIIPDLGSLELDVRVQPGWDFYEEGNATLRRTIAIDVITPTVEQTRIFRAGSPVEPFQLTLDLAGRVQDYPFDSYQLDVLINASEIDASGKVLQSIPLVGGMSSPEGLIGWQLTLYNDDVDNIRAQLLSGLFSVTPGEELFIELDITRALSTVTVSILMLTLMVILALSSISIAIVVRRRGGQVNPTYAGVVAALLFALIPIREFLPGAPPLGSWIDILVFFWVEIVLMVALISIIRTSVRRVRDRSPT
jgi:hypothetical protein